MISFHQRDETTEPLYSGKLYIDAQDKILTSAIYSLNITDKKMVARMYVQKKPPKANVWPTKVAYRFDYREKNGKWYYGYSKTFSKYNHF